MKLVTMAVHQIERTHRRLSCRYCNRLFSYVNRLAYTVSANRVGDFNYAAINAHTEHVVR